MIEKLNTVLEVRLRLHAAGQPSSLAKTWEMLPKLAKGIGAETTLKPLRMARRQRQPFLYAAQRVAPEFLTMNFEGRRAYKFITPEGLLSQMAAKAEKSRLVSEVVRRSQGDSGGSRTWQWSEEMVSALDQRRGRIARDGGHSRRAFAEESPAPPCGGDQEASPQAGRKLATRVAEFRCFQDPVERRVNKSHLGECGCPEDTAVNPQVRTRHMSKEVSPRRKRANADHDCVEDVDVLTERFLSECREDCGPEHAHHLALEMASAALRFILDADGPEDARGALVSIGKILEVEIKLHGIEHGTRH